MMGNNHSIAVSGAIPNGVTITYSKNGQAGNSAVELGTYEIEATLAGK